MPGRTCPEWTIGASGTACTRRRSAPPPTARATNDPYASGSLGRRGGKPSTGGGEASLVRDAGEGADVAREGPAGRLSLAILGTLAAISEAKRV